MHSEEAIYTEYLILDHSFARSSRKILKAYLRLEIEVSIDFSISKSSVIRSYLEASAVLSL